MYLVVSFQDAVHLCDFLAADCLDDEAFVVGQLEGRATPSRRVPVNGGVLAQRHLVDNTNMIGVIYGCRIVMHKLWIKYLSHLGLCNKHFVILRCGDGVAIQYL